MRRRLPTFVKFVHKLTVLERFPFTRVTRVAYTDLTKPTRVL